MHDYDPVPRFSDGESDISEKIKSLEEPQRRWKKTTIAMLVVSHCVLALLAATITTRWPLPIFRPEPWDNIITEHCELLIQKLLLKRCLN